MSKFVSYGKENKNFDHSMKNKLFAAFAVAALLSAGTALRAQDDVKDAYVRAVDFYEHGMFEREQTIFGEIASRTGDVLAKGYEALCSVRQQEKGSEAFSQQFIDDYPYSRLVPQIHFYRALNLFDNRDYKAAAREFSRVDESRVFGDQVAEYSFKKAYALFELGELDEAKEIFGKSERTAAASSPMLQPPKCAPMNFRRGNAFSTGTIRFGFE